MSAQNAERKLIPNLQKTVYFLPELEAATGKLDYPMINDYMFCAVRQSNNKAFTGLISSLLHIRPEDISSVVVTNPIVLGEDCRDKEFRLDINVMLNDKKLINLEMQVVQSEDWTIRSLSYLCRNFDNLSRGEDYANILPVVHIGILDFTLYKDAPEEDKVWGIDYWAELFKATTWEKLKMIAQSSEYMAEVSNSIFRMNATRLYGNAAATERTTTGM